MKKYRHITIEADGERDEMTAAEIQARYNDGRGVKGVPVDGVTESTARRMARLLYGEYPEISVW